LAKRVRSGRIDVFFDQMDDFVSIFEIKATDWDKILPQNRNRLLGAHRRQILKYIDQYVMAQNTNVCAAMIYPHAPKLDGVRELVEGHFSDWAIAVIWFE